ncbi:MAG: glycosyltransferase family A protein [Bacteroidales bacterium]|uniref:glycosyltransferase family 2 protein n=1 Tax=Porphyromonas sp. TaxID=1924944 RepID=UPI00297B551A|nr:glycosyltransferase family A protein [Porphyromonas sp.]MDD7438335.1 glycosyltransferase family A protein [Bacteroidales bacterium]MDY3066760.1 glycosyltransferase family A protein [Porphyromonas sp.]
MKISIVIPIYNSSLYLKECLTSIQKQSYSDFEAICMDDGSTDESIDICRDFESNDLRFKVYTQKNQGVSTARNNGLKYCSGEYVVFIDSDDVIDTDYLWTLYDLANPEVDLSFCHFCRRRPELGKKPKGAIEGMLSRESFIRKLLSRDIQYPTICSMLFRRSIIDNYKLSFRKQIYWGEDSLFYHEYIAKMRGQVAISAKALYYYRDNEESAMNTIVTYKALSAIEASKKTEVALVNAGLFPQASISLVSGTVLKLMYIAAMSNNMDLYKSLHQQYNVVDHITHIAKKSNILKHKLLSLFYLVFKRKAFFEVFSFIGGIKSRIHK